MCTRQLLSALYLVASCSYIWTLLMQRLGVRTARLSLQGCVQAVKEAVSYSRALASLANDPTLPPGLGPVSVFGGRLQTEGRDLRELFRCAAAMTDAVGNVPLRHAATLYLGEKSQHSHGWLVLSCAPTLGRSQSYSGMLMCSMEAAYMVMQMPGIFARPCLMCWGSAEYMWRSRSG